MRTNYFMAVALAAGAVSLAPVAHATVIKGVYVGAAGTVDLTQTQHNTSQGSSSQVGHAPGWGGNLSVGYGFGNGVRVEVEGLYLQSHINRVSPENAHGHDQNYGGLFNVVYDLDMQRNFGIQSIFTPYVGVGAGYMVGRYDVTSPVRNIGGTQGSFAYQGIVGTAIDTGVPGLQATVDYRMVGQTMSNTSYHQGDSTFDHRFNHTFNVGLRYAFDPAPPAPATVQETVVPAPERARTYLVFFDWDKADLTPAAKKVVANAAANSGHVALTRIEVNGYTDNSAAHPGARGAEYNHALSVRRANAVAAELVKYGVQKDVIDIHGYGEEHQLVATGPNTREAQNRRVEIILK